MIGSMFGAETPEHAAAVDRKIYRLLALGTVTPAAVANGFAATVVI
jgi:hypothetical protein